MGLFDIFHWKKERQQLQIQNAVLLRKQQELESQVQSFRDRETVWQEQIQSLTADLDAVSPQQQEMAEKARKEYQKSVKATQKIKALYDRYKYAVDCYNRDPDAEMPDIAMDDILAPIFVVDLSGISPYHGSRTILSKHQPRYGCSGDG